MEEKWLRIKIMLTIYEECAIKLIKNMMRNALISSENDGCNADGYSLSHYLFVNNSSYTRILSSRFERKTYIKHSTMSMV